MPRTGPRRELVALRLLAGGVAVLDELAREEVPLKGAGEPNRSEMVRRLLIEALTARGLEVEL
jgi:hypothetical protein